MLPKVKELPYLERLKVLNLWTLEQRKVRGESNYFVEVLKMP